jgi:hypothetical protein
MAKAEKLKPFEVTILKTVVKTVKRKIWAKDQGDGWAKAHKQFDHLEGVTNNYTRSIAVEVKEGGNVR